MLQKELAKRLKARYDAKGAVKSYAQIGLQALAE